MQKRAFVRGRVVGWGTLTAVLWAMLLASLFPKDAFRWHVLIAVGLFPFGVMWGLALCRWMDNAAREDRARERAQRVERPTAMPRPVRKAGSVAAHAVPH
jgi:hypothetical protein